MRFFRFGVIGALLAALAFTGIGSAAGTQKPPSQIDAKDAALADPNLKFVPAELLVKFKAGASAEARAAALAAHGASVKQELAIPNLRLVKLAHGKDVKAAAAALAARAEVEYAEPNWIYHAAATPNDPRYGQLWGLNQGNDADIDAPEAWDITTGTPGTVVAVVDTGVAYDHNDLAANIWANPGEVVDGLDNDGNGKVDDLRGWDFFDNDNNPRDAEGHGTHVSGTIGGRGNNAIGVTGVNWSVSIMPVRVLGPGGGTNAMVTSGFAYAAAEGAKVVNASLGCANCFSQAMKDAIDAASNTLFVVAAGNDGQNNESVPHYPCNYTSANLICVAATTQTDGLASFSDYGTTSVDLGAPGTDVMSTWLAYDTLFSDGFESATLTPVWTSGGTTASTWATTTTTFSAGARSGTDSPGVLYPNSSNTWIYTTSPTSFAARTGCQAVYDMRLDTEFGFDALRVEAATNAAGPWTQVDGWWGSTSGAFFNFETEMPTFNGQPAVYLRFRLQSDSTIQKDGAWLDQVKLRCSSAVYDADDFNSISGTSMATPHVAGVAGLIFAKNPTATVAQVRTALLESGDPLASLSGIVQSGKRLNAFNALSRFCTGRLATIVATPGSDIVTGTPGDDVIVGLGGNDSIDGGGGNDRICGGLGNDSLRGGLGNDTLSGDAGVDTLDYSLAPAAVIANLLLGTTTGGDGTDTHTGMENITGGAGADTLVGTNIVNVLTGGDGNDWIRGAYGNDILTGGLGVDMLDYAEAFPGVTVSLASNTSSGAAGNDTLATFESVLGTSYNDTLFGDTGRNLLIGGPGVDTLWGNDGPDQLRGGAGNDTMHGEGGVDSVDYSTAGTGVTVSLVTNTATGGGGSDTFDGVESTFGSPQGDNLTGNGFNNRIDGLAGDDFLFGLDGNDVLIGGVGSDSLDGGLNTDTCLTGEILIGCEA